jgi:hypothetical protein
MNVSKLCHEPAAFGRRVRANAREFDGVGDDIIDQCLHSAYDHVADHATVDNFLPLLAGRALHPRMAARDDRGSSRDPARPGRAQIRSNQDLNAVGRSGAAGPLVAPAALGRHFFCCVGGFVHRHALGTASTLRASASATVSVVIAGGCR